MTFVLCNHVHTHPRIVRNHLTHRDSGSIYQVWASGEKITSGQHFCGKEKQGIEKCGGN